MKINFTKLETAKKQVEVSFDGKSSTYFNVDAALENGINVSKAVCSNLKDIKIGGGVKNVAPSVSDEVVKYFNFETSDMRTIQFTSDYDFVNQIMALPENTKDNPYVIKVAGLTSSNMCSFNYAINNWYSCEYAGNKTISRYIDISPTKMPFFDWGKDLGDGRADRYPYNSYITSVTVPEGTTNIGCAFYGMRSIKTVDLPKTLESIGTWAFVEAKVDELRVSSDDISVDSDAFGYNTEINKLVITTPTYTQNFLVKNAKPKVLEFTNVKNIDYIGEGSYFVPTEEIILPATLESFGGCAFSFSDAISAGTYKIKYRGTEAQWAALKAKVNYPDLDTFDVECNYAD